MRFESLFFVRFFLLMFLFYGALSFVVPILYWTVSKNFEHLTKVPFYFAIFAMICVLYFKRFIFKDWFSFFLMFYAPFSFLLGIVFNDISSAFVSHFFPFILPLAGLSFGYLVARDYQAELMWFYRKIPLLGVWLAITTIFYYVSYNFGYLDYYGASSLLVLPFLYFLVNKKYTIVFVFLFLIVLSGKRSDLLSIVLTLLVYGFYRNPLVGSLVLFPVLSIFLTFLYDFGFLDRFGLLFNLYFNDNFDLELLNEFSSNRLNDALAAIDSINQSPFFWIFGQGFGVTYTYDAVTYNHTVHFTHFSPISYILLGGLVMFFFVYFKLIRLVHFSLSSNIDFFNLYLVFLFFLSLFGGSIFFTNPFYWFVVGVVSYRLSIKNFF